MGRHHDPARSARGRHLRPEGAEGSDIVVTGSVQLCQALIDADLVDEYRLFTYPHVEGSGRRLFENRTTVPALRAVEVGAFRFGLVLTRYRTDSARCSRTFAAYR